MTNKELKKQLEKLLFANTEQFWLNLYKHKYQQLVAELSQWPLIKNTPESEDVANWLQLQTIAFLRHKIDQQHGELLELEAGYRNFIERLSKADIAAEKELHILNYAQDLGADSEALKADKMAFSRWFDEGAVIDRFQRKVADIEQSLKFLISKLGALTSQHLKSSGSEIVETWKKLDLQPFFLNLLETSQNSHVRHGMIRALVNQVDTIYHHHEDPALNEDLTVKLVELLEEEDTPYLAEIDILEILIHQRPTFIRSHMWALIDESSNEYKEQPKNDEQLFILAAIPKILLAQLSLGSHDLLLLNQLSEHPYPRVRQALIESLPELELDHARAVIAIRFENEDCNAVRFTLIKQLNQGRYAEDSMAFEYWRKTLHGDYALEIKRIALEQSAKIMLNMQLEHEQPEVAFQMFITELNKALENEPSIAVKRYITRTREQLAGFYQQNLAVNIEEQLEKKGKLKISSAVEQETLGRMLSLRAQQQHAFNGKIRGKNWRVNPGYKLGRRFWRIWHEFFTPSTDKRQSFSHTSSKKPSAQLHVPSCTVAEISETNVPGEALYHLDEHSARPHLPLLDYLLSVLSQDHIKAPAQSYTPDGILCIHRPKSVWRRARSYWHISTHFEQLDGLRKGNELEQEKYLESLKELGFTLEFKAYGDVLGATFPVEPGIAKLFAKASIAPTLLNIWLNFREYLHSIYQNTISQLVFFVTGFMAYFWGRHVYISHKIKQNRKAIPVSIGGWGTRGKSGTERLKAALFSSLALRVITKTTGCEAMIIFGKSTGEQYEVPLFRPFDKASIWEQSDVLDFAQRTQADVFLWECMGLTPRYVRILRRWMQDNFATITNAYPDHEDILGPTGIDVAREMSAFIGENTQVFTSEQTMMPILSTAAQEKNTTLIQVHWGDGYQVTPDIRTLYPYEEHPDNIALVCKMAQYIGIDKDYVYKETAQRIVPDIGVLQHFQVAPVKHVSQSFVNSMSANERLATIENWKRLGLFDLNKEAHIQTIALINNRNDRVARSKVFAQILAEDLSYDFIVVIGTNVDGFNSYLTHAVNDRVERMLSNNDAKDLHKLIDQLNMGYSNSEWLDIINYSLQQSPLDLEDIANKESLQQALSSRLPDDEAQRTRIITFFENWQMALPLLEIEDLPAQRQLITQVLTELFKAKCILVEQAYVTPDQLTHTIAQLGLNNQHQLIVGMQNIKGAGLNYVYMWQQWQKVYDLCNGLLSSNTRQADFRKLLLKLAQQPKFSSVEIKHLVQVIDQVMSSEHAQNEFSQAELRHILEKVERSGEEEGEQDSQEPKSKLSVFVTQVMESFLDAGAAVKRKKTAQQVYQDMADQRITVEKAITVLAQLNRSQKPGWLASSNKSIDI